MASTSPSNAREAKLYQIDFTAVACGKRIASSKRRVRWRFGFANPQALAAGETGTACRGEEHDVTLVWSITSGKVLVLADGKEVHYSTTRNAIFDYSWTMRGNHVLKVVAHANPPLSITPGFRQYDFMVDGQSYFTFPKVFRLGLNPNDPRASAAPTSPAQMAERGKRYSSYSESVRSANIAEVEAPSNPDEEEAYLAEAIRQSLEDDGELPVKAQKGSANSGGDLLDFESSAPFPALPPSTSDPFSAPVLAPSTTYGSEQAPFATLPPSTTSTYAPSSDPWGAQSYAAASASSNGALQGQAMPYGLSVAALPALPPSEASMNGYGQSYAQAVTTAPQAFPSNPSASWAPPTQNGGYKPADPWTVPAPINTHDLGGVGGPQQTYGYDVPHSVTPQAQQTPSTIGFGSPPAADFAKFSPAPQSAPGPALSMEPALFSMNTLASTQDSSPPSFDEGDAAPSKSLTDQAFAKLVNLDTLSLGSKEATRSNPFEYSGNSTIGATQSLSDMKQRIGQSGEKKDVMRTPVAAPGAMVVAANQNGAYGGQYGMQQPMQAQPGYGMGQSAYQQQQPGAYGMQQQQQQYGQPQYNHYQNQPPPQQMYAQAPPHPYAQPQMSPFGQQPTAQPQGYPFY